MTQRVFVKVVGFTDVERHALNSLFRLSEARDTVYSLWQKDAPERPRLALVDGQSFEARLELAAAPDPHLKLIWVGAVAPVNAWRTYERPLSWPEVVRAMDALFAPPSVLDFDLDSDLDMIALDVDLDAQGDADAIDTRPPDEPRPPPRKRALIAAASRDERLYLRAKLALAELTEADEAETGAQALELARDNDYAVALLDFGLPDFDGWALVKEIGGQKRRIPHVVLTKSRASMVEQLRARIGGLSGLFDKPPHPGKLHELLVRVAG